MIVTEYYTITPYDIGTWMVEKSETEEANIVDMKEMVCTCQDFNFRQKTKKECKHIKMVKAYSKYKEVVHVERIYDKKTKKEDIKVL
jgi:predicted nucleic acid-binding Zn finger protein